MKLQRLSIYSISVAMTLFLASCGGGSKTTESDANQSAAGSEFDEAKSQIVSDINDVIKNLPPPAEVPYLLMATGSDFDVSLIKIECYSFPSIFLLR